MVRKNQPDDTEIDYHHPLCYPFKSNLKFPPPDLDCSVRKLTFAATNPMNDETYSTLYVNKI